jgi:hypothetical protein
MGLEHPGAGARRGPYLPAIFAGEAQIEVEVIWTENVRTAAVVTVRQLDSAKMLNIGRAGAAILTICPGIRDALHACGQAVSVAHADGEPPESSPTGLACSDAAHFGGSEGTARLRSFQIAVRGGVLCRT